MSDRTYTDGAIADSAIDQLRQKDERPFFLAVGFKKPHLPLVVLKKYWDMYDPAEIKIPASESPVGVAEQATTSWSDHGWKLGDHFPKTRNRFGGRCPA